MPDALLDKLRQIAEHVPTFNEYATDCLGVLWRADDLALCLGVRDPALAERSRHWHTALARVAREVRAASIVAGAGFQWGEPLPDSAEPRLQELIGCREEFPGSTYDSQYCVHVRHGMALIVHTPSRSMVEDYWEWVAGAPMPKPPIARTLTGINAKVSP